MKVLQARIALAEQCYHVPNMLRVAKLGSLRVARALGFSSRVMHSRWRQSRLLILAWHGFSMDDEHEWNPGLYLSPSTLRRRLELIGGAGCHVLPLDTAVRLLYRGELPPRPVALTIDDGAHDFYSVGFPLFQRFGFPVTVYQTTYYANFNRPVYDVMASYLLWKGRGRTLRWPEVMGTGAVELSGSALAYAAGRFRRYASEQGLSGAGKDALLSRLAERLEVDYASILERRILHLMTIGEAREVAAHGVDFQLHTHRHGVSLGKALFLREVADNRAWLQRIRSGEATHFCYPGGVHRPEFVPWLREAGIVSAATCEAGLAERRTDPLLLPRLVDTNFFTEEEFLAWLSGIAACLPRKRYLEEEGQLLEERLGRAAAAQAAGGR
jgi:peptidoglycan/xylan/chitin deacetylase (PgdA/CDA1 family)